MPDPEKTLHKGGLWGFFVARIGLEIVLAHRGGLTFEREF